jgi:hypothetical protein
MIQRDDVSVVGDFPSLLQSAGMAKVAMKAGEACSGETAATPGSCSRSIRRAAV